MKINDHSFVYYKKMAENFANELTKNISYPIDIISLCNNLKINIVYDINCNDTASLNIKNNKFYIKLGRQYNNKNSPFVRYMLAHEIGHYFINHKLCATISKNEYWVFEELCDYFARVLLLPNKFVNNIPSTIGNNLYQLLNFTKYLSNEFNVTWITSISRVKDVYDQLLFLNFKFSKTKNRFIVNKSLLPKNKYLNSHLMLNRKLLYQMLSGNRNEILITSEDQLFIILSSHFPLIFSSNNKEVLFIFRRNNIAVLAINYYAQQSHSH